MDDWWTGEGPDPDLQPSEHHDPWPSGPLWDVVGIISLVVLLWGLYTLAGWLS